MVKSTAFMTPLNMVLLALLALAIAYLFYLLYKRLSDYRTKEHFTEDEYSSRMEVIKVFDLVLNRKPSPEEIEKYKEYQNEQDILVNVLKDFKKEKVVTDEEVVIEEEAEVVKSKGSKTSEKSAIEGFDKVTKKPTIKKPEKYENQDSNEGVTDENVEDSDPTESQPSTLNKITEKVSSLTDLMLKKKEMWQQSGMQVDGDRVCVNKYFLKQILDDVQSKIDAMRVLIK